MMFRGLAQRRGLLGRVLDKACSFSKATAGDVTTDVNPTNGSLLKLYAHSELCTQGVRAFSSRAPIHTGLLPSRTPASVPEVARLPFSLVNACIRTSPHASLVPMTQTRGMANKSSAQKNSALKVLPRSFADGSRPSL